MTAFEYVRAPDAALAIADPVERRRAHLRVRNARNYYLIKSDPDRYRRLLDKIAAAKRARRAKA